MSNGEKDLAVVIMAGGRGTRFWPASTRKSPKQFLALAGGRSLLGDTVERALGLAPAGRVFVVASQAHRVLVEESVPELPGENILFEPEGRNTAPCIGWAASILSERLDDPVMAVLPSDHMIRDVDGFVSTVREGAGLAGDGWLVTIGITPTRAATGYGYLEVGEPVGGNASAVRSFREKPDVDTATCYLESGKHLWNAGMFIWRASRILEEIAIHIPELSVALDLIGRNASPEPGLYSSLPSVSIDYGVMEKAAKVAVLPARFDWDDLGDWPSIRRAGVARGRALAVDADDVTLWCEDGSLTVLLGMKGVSVVRTSGVTLVMSDEYSQKLREVVRKLEEDSPDLV